jgi:hypothetical protein
MKTAIVVGTLAFALFVSQSAFGQSASEQRLRSLEQKIDYLERRVRELEKSRSPDVAERRTSAATGDPNQRANWRALKRGMTEQDVRKLLGEPPKIDSSIALIFWQWPTGGIVHFEVDSRRVTGWSEP